MFLRNNTNINIKSVQKGKLGCIYKTFLFTFHGKLLCNCNSLTHWGRVTHGCASKLATIGSDNGLSPGRCQAIIWTYAGILLIGPLGTNLSEILNQNLYIFIQENAFENVVWKMTAILSLPQCVKTIVILQRPVYIHIWDPSLVMTAPDNAMLPSVTMLTTESICSPWSFENNYVDPMPPFKFTSKLEIKPKTCITSSDDY